MKKLFQAAPAALNKQEAAAWRAKHFDHTYGALAKEWDEKLMASGLAKEEVLCERHFANNIARDFDGDAEQFYIDCRRFYWVGDFTKTGVDHLTAKRIWKLFCEGYTFRAIAAEIESMYPMKAHRVITELLNQMGSAAKAGRLAPTPDSKAEKVRWDRFRQECAAARANVALLKTFLRLFNDLTITTVEEALDTLELPYGERLNTAIEEFEAARKNTIRISA